MGKHETKPNPRENESSGVKKGKVDRKKRKKKKRKKDKDLPTAAPMKGCFSSLLSHTVAQGG
jgi:hypothetical protein